MKARWSLLVPAALAAAIPITIALAQTAPPPPQRPEGRPRLSDDALARLHEGRLAMAKGALKLDDAQLRLWAPVEEQLRGAHAARQKMRQARLNAREERREAREQGQPGQPRPSLADRIDRASQRMTERAQRMQAFSAAFKPFYETLSDEQKAVAGLVLRELRGGPGPRGGPRWTMNRDRGGDEGRQERRR